MARARNVEDVTTLQMALVGFELEKQKIDEKIRQIQAQLKGKRIPMPSSDTEVKPAPVKRNLSPAARKRIAEAQKKRWAEHRKRAAQSKGAQ